MNALLYSPAFLNPGMVFNVVVHLGWLGSSRVPWRSLIASAGALGGLRTCMLVNMYVDLKSMILSHFPSVPFYDQNKFLAPAYLSVASWHCLLPKCILCPHAQERWSEE